MRALAPSVPATSLLESATLAGRASARLRRRIRHDRARQARAPDRGGDPARHDRCGRIPGVGDRPGADQMAGNMNDRDRSRASHLSVVRALQPLGVRAAVCARRRAAGCPPVAVDLGDGGLDSGGDGGGAQRGDGLQPARRRPVRCAQPANRQPRDPPRRDVHARGRRVRRRRGRGLRLRGLAVEPDLFRAVAGGARHRVLVLAGETLHGVDAAVPRARDGGRAGRRVARGRRTRRSGAVAARASRLAPGSAASTSCMRARTSTSIARTACARSRCGSVCDRRSRYHARCTW